MPSEYDATEFVDDDFRAASKAASGAPMNASGASERAPSREEVDARMTEAQQKLAELKRVQEELERERAGLEETRRRQLEFQNGRQETINHLTRGIGLLTESEFAARRDAEQMAKALADMQAALVKVEAINEKTWTKDNFAVELTRALTIIENARMEWNSARLKFPVLSGNLETAAPGKSTSSPQSSLTGLGFGQLLKVGLALTWPLALAVIAIGVLMVVLWRH
ncbi:MAG TPA: hypothetical protein VFB72_20450 [Verrucomicrobiae bacterium]|nr:hypothetical protein [Verrucomicrobiae bacterium]